MQIKPRQTRCNKWWFIDNQLFLYAHHQESRLRVTAYVFMSWLWLLWFRRVGWRDVYTCEKDVAPRLLWFRRVGWRDMCTVKRMLPPGCCGSVESGGEICALWRGFCPQATFFSQCTHLATRLSGTTTIARTWNYRQWHAVCCSDDGRKDARTVLRNNLLAINHHLLHLVGLAFICLCKMHRQWNIKHKILCFIYLITLTKDSVSISLRIALNAKIDIR
jgi:hypothetical protein